VGWLVQHCTSIVLCPPNSTRISRDIQIDKWTQGLEGSSLSLFTDGNPYQLSNISKNIIFNTKLLILNIDIA